MASTGIYQLPYLELSDPPDIPGVTKGLAEAVEDELVRVESLIPGPRPPRVVQSLSDGVQVTTSEATILTVQWDVVSGQQLSIRFSGQWRSNGADRQLTLRLKEDGVTIKTRRAGSPTNNADWPVFVEAVRSPAAGQRTYTITAQVSVFTGNIDADAELSVGLT